MAEIDLSKLRIDKTKSYRRHAKRRRLAVLALLLLGLAGAGVLYERGILKTAVEVQVSSVQRFFPSQGVALLNASGYVVAQRKAAVASKLTGRLVFLGVEEGSRVEKGQVIARLENEDAIAARDRAAAALKVARYGLDEAEAELADALRDHDRKKKLVRQGYVSLQEKDAAEARLRRAEAAAAGREAAIEERKAALHEAEVMLDYTFIRAPFDAVVLTKDADVGDIVAPLGAAASAKASVVTIADMASLQAEVDVSESNISQVREGQPCEIQLDAFPDERFPGKVHMIVPTADRSKASVLVKAAFEEMDPRILPEMSVKVAFLSRRLSPDERKPLIGIPVSAVIERDGKHAVFAVVRNRVKETGVRVGRRLGEMAEILTGVGVGDKVVISPLDEMDDGVRIRILQE